ncbi:hypothetical protein J6590_051648 [Homalodisca vitripennis]|nr:hypothetical protein J6590_051648 [Homalodisca vitripennis]
MCRRQVCMLLQSQSRGADSLTMAQRDFIARRDYRVARSELGWIVSQVAPSHLPTSPNKLWKIITHYSILQTCSGHSVAARNWKCFCRTVGIVQARIIALALAYGEVWATGLLPIVQTEVVSRLPLGVSSVSL